MSNPETSTGGQIKEATQSLSQFIARVLNQLSLSAWLPAAALVLASRFIFELGAVLDSPRPDANKVGLVIKDTTDNLVDIGFGGLAVLLILIVVLTMLTQAFAFESIRVLEGYWGPFRLFEWLSDLGCLWARFQVKWLQNRRKKLLKQSWIEVKGWAKNDGKKRLKRGEEILYTAERLEQLRRHVRDKAPLEDDDQDKRKWIRNFDWKEKVSPRRIQRITNVEKRLRDYPVPKRVLPTRLGNVIRHHEDATDQENLEAFIQRVWPTLPLSIQIDHDEHRTRLDLYCSMFFIFPMLAVIAVFRLQSYESYMLTCVAISLVLMWWTYRAAVACARAYGQILVLIANEQG